MKRTIIVLVALCLVGVSVAAPASADEGSEQGEDGDTCVKVFLDPPGVVVDPDCIEDHIPPI